MRLPPCHSWKLWTGGEVEGRDELGVPTVFIRSLPSTLKPDADFSFLRGKNRQFTRVWFCKEYTNWEMVRAIAAHFRTVCIEVEPKCYSSLPLDFRRAFKIYLKVDIEGLKTGDVVCVGRPFQDEAFIVGTGKKVTPDAYLSDKVIVA